VFLLINNQYAISLVRNQVVQSSQNLVSLYMSQIDKELDVIDDYFNKLIGLNSDVRLMALDINENSQNYYSAKIRLAYELRTSISNYKTMDMLFIYSEPNQDLLLAEAQDASYQDVNLWKAHVEALVADPALLSDPITDGWFITDIDQTAFICRLRQLDSVVVGAMVKAEKIMVPLTLIDLGDDGAAVIVDEDFVSTSMSSALDEKKISLDFRDKSYLLTGSPEKYLVVGSRSTNGQFGLAAFMPYRTVLKSLPYFQNISMLIPIITMFIVLIWLMIIARFFFKPVNDLTFAMRKLEKGNFQVRIPYKRSSAEFELMNETFNSMAAEIEDLKIEVYEDKLNIQQAEMEHLKLQINPHFFLNSLNIIYQMANEKDYALIQEMASSLVDYFRFIFKSNMNFVLLEEEIRHTRNYLKIQEMRFPEHLTFSIDMPEYLSRHLVPPLMIQSFVENSIKYALSMEAVLEITIRADLTGTIENPLIEISIQDNGPGFPADILDKLQQQTSETNTTGEHVGIWNVRRRLHLLYHDQAVISFTNLEQGGALVVITLPLKI